MTQQQHNGVDLDTAVRQIRDRLAATQRERVRAEAEAAAARAAGRDALLRMRDEFGVTDLDTARTQLATLEADLAAEVAGLSDALDQMGA